MLGAGPRDQALSAVAAEASIRRVRRGAARAVDHCSILFSPAEYEEPLRVASPCQRMWQGATNDRLFKSQRAVAPSFQPATAPDVALPHIWGVTRQESPSFVSSSLKGRRPAAQTLSFVASIHK